jgi:hypothetical protein
VSQIVVDKVYMQTWYHQGELHRNNDKPAVIYANGDQEWYQHDNCHRDDDKPAVICINSSRCWFQNNIQYKHN